MKLTKLLGVLMFILMCSCGKNKQTSVTFSHSDDVNIIRIRGCEYVYYRGYTYSGTGPAGGICHAGDCDNPIHRAGTIAR